MRLFTRIFIYYLVISLAVFSIGGYAFYYVFKKEVYEELDEQMRDEKKNIERILSSNDSTNSYTTGINFSVSIIPYSIITLDKSIERKDTLMNHPYEGQIPSRQWRFFVFRPSQTYQVTIRKSLIDIEDLSEQIASSLIYGYLAFLAASVLVNFFIFKRIFKPFYRTLNKVKNYALTGSSILNFPKTNTKEFNELNSVLEGMSKRINDDFLNMKEYTENASHEIQTPLAIISSRLELLMQNELLDEKQAGLITSAYEATNRLYRLNQSLITLSRIENREFQNESEEDLIEILKHILSNVKDQFDLKGIHLSIDLKSEFKVFIHSTLAEILLQNILSNALRYSSENGRVVIIAHENFIQIKNSGVELSFPPDKIFKRFVRSGNNARSLGIGLSLVNKIADVFSLKLDYQYLKDESMHSFTISK